MKKLLKKLVNYFSEYAMDDTPGDTLCAAECYAYPMYHSTLF